MKKSKAKRISLWIVISLLILLGIYTVGGGLYMVNFALLPKEKAAKSYRTAYKRAFEKYTFMKPWVDSLNSCKAIHDTTITNAEGLRLHGYYIRAAQKTRK